MGRLAATDFDGSPETPEAPPPQVFVRTFTTPAALPWDQARGAQLEARHGAPLPLADLMHRVKRLQPWAPGRSATFAVFYVRRKDYTAPFETVMDVDGQAVRVAFGARTRSFRAPPSAVLATGSVAISLAILGAAATMAWSARTSAEAELQALEAQAAARARLADRTQAQRRQVTDLERARAGSAAPADVLADLAWINRAKTPEARIVAVHWERGVIALETRGEAPPISAFGAELVRSERPLRSGVWLWGVQRGGNAGAGGTP